MQIRLRSILASAAIVISALACNFPGVGAGQPSPTPATPDLTMTALFALLTGTPPATGAPATLPPTETLVPTATVALLTDTPQPTPTDTATPTVSYVGPDARSGVSVSAYHMATPPTIDGLFDEWDMERYVADRVVYGRGQWSGEADLWANFMLGWDNSALYLAVRVKDERYKQLERGEDLFKGDSLELLLDTDVSSDFYYQALTSDDFQLGISPGSPQPGDDPEAYLWYPTAWEGSRSQVKIAAMPTSDGYRVEARIPWSIFGVDPVKGQHFGFVLSVSDSDQAGEAVQQSMVANLATRVLTNPTTWGDLVLKKP